VALLHIIGKMSAVE